MSTRGEHKLRSVSKKKKKKSCFQRSEFQILSEKLLKKLNSTNENDPILIGKIRDQLIRMKQKEEVVETDPLIDEVLVVK
jgi:hypothetical protein